MKMIVGKRYSVPHGIGIYRGYEEFYDNGFKHRIVPAQPPGDERRVFDLEYPNNWPFREGTPYAAWAKEIEYLMDENYDE